MDSRPSLTPSALCLQCWCALSGQQKANVVVIDEQGNESNALDYLMPILKMLMKKASVGAIGYPEWYRVNSWLNETQIKVYLGPGGMFVVTPVNPAKIPWKQIMLLLGIDHAVLGMVMQSAEEWKLFLGFEKHFDIGFATGILREFFLWKFTGVKLPLIGTCPVKYGINTIVLPCFLVLQSCLQVVPENICGST